MTNAEIAKYFDLLSKLMDIHGENRFKTNTYSVAAYKIEKWGEPLEPMSAVQIRTLPGIGEAVTQKIIEIRETGRLDLLDTYIARTPPGVVEMLSLKGIGPKKIAQLWKELQLESIGELEYACNENRLLILKGFGAKTQESILKSIAFMRHNLGYYLWKEARGIAEQVLADLSAKYPGHRIYTTGAYRRQLPTLQTIEYVTDISKAALNAHFKELPDVVLEEEEMYLKVRLPAAPVLQFYYCAKEHFYQQLFLLSGSEAFLQSFAAQYAMPEEAAEEAAIFAHNQLAFVPAPLREHPGILEKARSGSLPVLLQPADIKGIIHSHSTWSDGVHSLEQMAKAARDKGYEYLVISDHSQAAVYAKGLSPESILQQQEEIDRLNIALAPFRIFKSIEADILYDGSLDYTPEILATFDLVIASVHSNLKMTQEKAMQRLLTAIHNPFTTILGHATGRLLLSREGYPIDHKTIIDACIANQVVIEINAHPRRLDLDWTWIPYALEKGALLSVNPDAHSIEGMDLVQYGVWAAQKGGLTKEHNLSSKTRQELEAFLLQSRKKG